MAKEYDGETKKRLFGERQSHESWGLMSISRHSIGGGGQSLFGSGIRHHNTVVLTISKADIYRSLNCNRPTPTEELIEIEMSPTQWAEAITHMNCGVGTPVTLRYMANTRISECPFVDERQTIEDEFDEHMQDVAKQFSKGLERVRELFEKKSTITVAEKKEILEILTRVHVEMGPNTAFIHSQFNEAVEKTITEAKGEIESFYTAAVMSAGKAALGIDYQKPEVPMLTVEPNPETGNEKSETGD